MLLEFLKRLWRSETLVIYFSYVLTTLRVLNFSFAHVYKFKNTVMATVLEGTKIEEKKLQEIVACAKDRAMINGRIFI